MSRATRVRVSFELTRQEAEMFLPDVRFSRAAHYRDYRSAHEKLLVAVRRGIARYDARTKGEVGDG